MILLEESVAYGNTKPDTLRGTATSGSGKKAKYSMRADIFRFTPKTGHDWKPLSCPFRAQVV